MLRLILSALVLCFGVSQALAADRQPKEHIVQIVSDYDNLRMYFKPKLLIIKPGDKVTWVNQVAEDHNIVSYPDGFPKGGQKLESPYLKKRTRNGPILFRSKKRLSITAFRICRWGCTVQ